MNNLGFKKIQENRSHFSKRTEIEEAEDHLGRRIKN
jgi:hypothetical protein